MSKIFQSLMMMTCLIVAISCTGHAIKEKSCLKETAKYLGEVDATSFNELKPGLEITGSCDPKSDYGATKFQKDYFQSYLLTLKKLCTLHTAAQFGREDASAEDISKPQRKKLKLCKGISSLLELYKTYDQSYSQTACSNSTLQAMAYETARNYSQLNSRYLRNFCLHDYKEKLKKMQNFYLSAKDQFCNTSKIKNLAKKFANLNRPLKQGLRKVDICFKSDSKLKNIFQETYRKNIKEIPKEHYKLTFAQSQTVNKNKFMTICKINKTTNNLSFGIKNLNKKTSSFIYSFHLKLIDPVTTQTLDFKKLPILNLLPGDSSINNVQHELDLRQVSQCHVEVK